MKTLKFAPNLVKLIISGEKTSTWRLFDDKDLTVGDRLQFINKETGQVFGTAIIISLKIKTLSTISDEDWDGHVKYSSQEEMIESFQKYYGNKVDFNSEVKTIVFSFEKE